MSESAQNTPRTWDQPEGSFVYFRIELTSITVLR